MEPSKTPVTTIQKQLGSGILSLDPGVLGPECYAALSGLFGPTPLSLTNAVIISATDSQINFNGSVELFSTDVTLEGCLFDHGSERQAIFKFVLAAEIYQQKYKTNSNEVIDDSTETMIDLYAPEIIYDSQAMIFSSLSFADDQDFDRIYPSHFAAVVPAAQIKAGLNFPLTVTFDDDFSDYIAELFSGELHAGVDYGLFYLPPPTDDLSSAPKPYFLVSRALNASVHLSPIGTPALQMGLERFGLGFALVDEGEIWPQVILHGSVGMAGSVLSFDADYDLYNRFLEVTFRGFPSLKTLLESFCDPAEYFSAPFDTLLEIQLSSLEIGFDLSEKSVTEIKLSLTTENDIELVPSIVSIQPTLELRILSPFDAEARSFEGTLAGDWALGSSKFETSLSYPSYDLHAALAEGETLDIDALARLVFEADLPQIAIEKLELNGNFIKNSFAFGLEISSDWEIPLTDTSSLALQQMRVGMIYADEEREYNFSSLINLAGVEIHISAQHVTEGWQFEGSTGAGQEIEIGKLLEDLAVKFGAEKPELPTALANLAVQDLGVSFNTKSKDFKFTCKASSGSITSELTIDINHQNGNYEMELGGNFEVELDTQTSLNFELKYKREDNIQEKKKTQVFVASYHHTGKLPLSITDLVTILAPDDTGLEVIIEPLNVVIDLNSVVFAYYKESSTEPGANGESPELTKLLFGLTLDIGASVDLSGLPLVGDELASIAVEDLQLVLALQPFEASHVEAVNGLLPEGVTKLPIKAKTSEAIDSEPTEAKPADDKTPPILTKGINLSALLNLGGDEPTPLVLSPSSSEEQAKGDMVAESTPATDTSIAPVSQPPAPSVKWIKIQKSFGPVHFEQIGFQFESPKQMIWFLLDASLTAAGLTISLDGLGFGSNITKFEPEFKLQGLGVNFKNDQVEIGGAFLKMSENEYGGAAILKTKKFSLSAIGTYAYQNGHPSMFIYAFLDYPLGGPPVFYVTGLAAGFGYNRTLLMPPIDQVDTFPLIEAVKKGKADVEELNPGAELEKLGEYVPVQTGQYFLAAGVEFTSFKMIESFALLAVSFGQRLEIGILGISTIKIPCFGDKQLSEIKVAFKASYIPDEGILKVIAQLTSDSYILSKENHPTGGLAFYSWFAGEHAGDFVLSVGGYHSKFNVPAHYPQVPRLALSWKVTPQLSIKGDGYFALTPSVLMAGGNLEANWHSGPLEAWFKAQVDFLIAWTPFHYDATMHVNMGIAYTISIKTWFGSWQKRLTAELGTDLHIWGPEFSGTAHIKVAFITFDIKFGGGSSEPPAIGWNDFRGSFLPDDILSVSVRNGLISSANEENPAKDDLGSSANEDTPAISIIDLGIIDPKDFSLVVDSAIPVRNLNGNPAKYEVFGIAPMKINDFNTELVITIKRDGQDCTAEFEFTPIAKNVPAGLWGTKSNPDLNSDRLVKGVISGFEIRVKSLTERTVAAPSEVTAVGVASKVLESRESSTSHVPTDHDIQEIIPSQPIPKEQELDLQWEQDLLVSTDLQVDPINIIQDSLKTAYGRRQDMLAALGFESDVITIEDSLAEAFVVAPQIEG